VAVPTNRRTITPYEERAAHSRGLALTRRNPDKQEFSVHRLVQDADHPRNLTFIQANVSLRFRRSRSAKLRRDDVRIEPGLASTRSRHIARVIGRARRSSSATSAQFGVYSVAAMHTLLPRRVTFRPNRTLHCCPSIGPVLIQELTFRTLRSSRAGRPLVFRITASGPSATAFHRSAWQKPPRFPDWQSRTPRGRCRRGAGST
jgi:hypothetical protein